jgi:hypothetical protein
VLAIDTTFDPLWFLLDSTFKLKFFFWIFCCFQWYWVYIFIVYIFQECLIEGDSKFRNFMFWISVVLQYFYQICLIQWAQKGLSPLFVYCRDRKGSNLFSINDKWRQYFCAPSTRMIYNVLYFVNCTSGFSWLGISSS